MGFENDVMAGIADLLAVANVAAWDPAGEYAGDQPGTYVQVEPTTPSGALTLTTYPVTDDPSLSDSVLGLQVKSRMPGEDPRPTNDLDDAVFDQIHGLTNVTLSTGVRLVECLRRSGTLLGMDDQRRWTRASNYYLTLWRPSLNRT